MKLLSHLAASGAELRRRKVFNVAAIYLAAAFGLLQLADIVFPVFAIEEANMRWVIIALVFGFPIALIGAWLFEYDAGLEAEDEEKAIPGSSRKTELTLIALLAVLVCGIGTALLMQNDQVDASERSIAVLPFVNLSAEPQYEYFGDGLAEELLNVLAKVPDLEVASRTSAFAYKGKEDSIKTIGNSLEVAHVLEGSVRYFGGDTLRITAQLIRVEDDRHLWTETYDGSVSDLLKVQDDIAAAILEELKGRLLGEALANELARPTNSPTAYDHYLQARHALHKRTVADIQTARDLFMAATADDPRFGQAWSGLAESWLLLVSYGGVEADEGFPEARLALEKAEILLGASADLLAIKGLYEESLGNKEQAVAVLTQALALEPEHAYALLWRGTIYSRQEEYKLALADFSKAYAVEPFSRPVLTAYAQAMTQDSQYAKARDAYQRLIEVDPTNAGNHARRVASLYSVEKEPAQAANFLASYLQSNPKDLYTASALVRRLVSIEALDEANLWFDYIQSNAPESDVYRNTAMYLYASEGNYKDAFAIWDAKIRRINYQAQLNSLVSTAYMACRAGNLERSQFYRDYITTNADIEERLRNQYSSVVVVWVELETCLGNDVNAEGLYEIAFRRLLDDMTDSDYPQRYLSGLLSLAVHRGDYDTAADLLKKIWKKEYFELFYFRTDQHFEASLNNSAIKEIVEDIAAYNVSQRGKLDPELINTLPAVDLPVAAPTGDANLEQYTGRFVMANSQATIFKLLGDQLVLVDSAAKLTRELTYIGDDTFWDETDWWAFRFGRDAAGEIDHVFWRYAGFETRGAKAEFVTSSVTLSDDTLNIYIGEYQYADNDAKLIVRRAADSIEIQLVPPSWIPVTAKDAVTFAADGLNGEFRFAKDGSGVAFIMRGKEYPYKRLSE